MVEAASAIKVILMEHEDDAAFDANYNEAEIADHNHVQKSNQRVSNRAKLQDRAKIQCAKKKQI